MAFGDSSGPQLPRITCIRPNHEVRRDHATHKHHALQPIHEAEIRPIMRLTAQCGRTIEFSRR